MAYLLLGRKARLMVIVWMQQPLWYAIFIAFSKNLKAKTVQFILHYVGLL